MASGTRSTMTVICTVMPGLRRGSAWSMEISRSKLRGMGQPAEKSEVAMVPMCSILPVNWRSGMASSCSVTGCDKASRPRSVSSTRAAMRIEAGSGSSAIGVPGQARSPALKGASPPLCQMERRLMVPSAGALNVMEASAVSARWASNSALRLAFFLP